MLLLAAGIAYGMLAYKFELPPYALFENVEFGSPKKPGVSGATIGETPDLPREFLETPSEYLEIDVNALISIRHSDDIAITRSALTNYLWGNPRLPTELPTVVLQDFSDERYDEFPDLSRIDKLIVEMEFGLESHIYHFRPKSPNNKIVLFHQGHKGDFFTSEQQISTFISNGYSVVAFSMPLLGLNNRPTVKVPMLGKLRLTQHDNLKFLSPISGHPLKFFIEPVFAAINYVEEHYSYSSISMVGISGGGWTTTIAAALDTRIQLSFPIAGSYPLYLRSNSARDWGDYEQTVPEFYKTINYPTLYVLGASGLNRKQLQIINQYDTCCFAGTKWNTYLDIVRKRVANMGPGEFELFMDNSHRDHAISPVAMKRIIRELDESIEQL